MKNYIDKRSGVRKRHIHHEGALCVDTNSCRIQEKAPTAKTSDHNKIKNIPTTQTGVQA